MAIALATSLAAGALHAAPCSSCRALQAPPFPSDATACALPASGVPADGAIAVTALFARFDAAARDGRLDEAASTLACVETQVARSGDWKEQHDLMRRRGVLDYRQERISDALQRFECALEMGEAHHDRAVTARDLKNIGAALRRLGDFRNALAALTRSLDLERATGGDAGAVHNNIADVYRELEDPTEAFRHYRLALEAFRRRGNRIEAAHVLESMSVLALDTGAPAQAEPWLQEALSAYGSGEHRPYQLRVYASLTRAAIAQDQLRQARRWVGEGLDLAAANNLPIPATLQLQAARVERLEGRPAQASARLKGVLATLADNDVDRGAVLEELSLSQEAMGANADAIAALRQADAAERRLAKAQADRQLGWLRSRFEAADRERTISDLQMQNRQRRLQLWLTLCAATAAVLAVCVVFIRWRQRARVDAAMRQARHDDELARYRRETSELMVDRKLLQALLASRDDAICMLDAEGQVLTATAAACQLLGVAEEQLIGQSFADRLDADDAGQFAAALERMEDTPAQALRFMRGDAGTLTAQLTEWGSGEGIIVLALGGADAPEPEAVVAPVAAAAPEARATRLHEAGVREAFRRTLVELMLAVVETWERSTGQSRLELAEQSRIWRVTVDDGRLRARAMERYLVLARLPQQPRWRDVLRSAYFVLGRCALEAEVRSGLQERVDAVLAYTRRSALV